MTTTDAQGAVTTALMAACQDEDVDRVQELLAADKQVRLANWYTRAWYLRVTALRRRGRFVFLLGCCIAPM